MYEHDITHQISITKEIVASFFDNASVLLCVGSKTKQEKDVKILPATDPRFSGEIKTLLQAEGGVDVNDLIVIYKYPKQYTVDLIKTSDVRYAQFNELFNNSDRHVVIYSEDISKEQEEKKVSAEEQKEKFKAWFSKQKKETGENYNDATITIRINAMESWYANHKKSEYNSIFDIQEVCVFNSYYDSFKDSEEFKKFNETTGNKAAEYGFRFYKDFLNELDGPKNLILYGVPGCGKSHYIKENYKCNSDNTERIVFHPDYTYSDFVGQIMPDNKDDKISYPFIPGPFTRILTKACNPDNKEKVFYLIIEEINRGNAPAIFGDIFQLLDRDDSGKSKYTITNKEIAQEIRGKDTNDFNIFLPSNLILLATMNTADQNVFTLDTAFKRRWTMKNIENNFDKHKYSEELICNEKVTWKTFVERINQKIIELNKGFGTEDKRIGTYFASKKELNDVDLFAHKVLMYLWNDAFQYNHDDIFIKECKTLEGLIAEFKKRKFGVFKDTELFKESEESLKAEQQ